MRILKIVACFLSFLIVAAADVMAQTPREQLEQMTSDLRKAPDNRALRISLIKLAGTIRPLPAVSEEAREPFVMGATIMKRASDPTDAARAVELFTKSLSMAPWNADAYFNRAIAQQTAGNFSAANEDFRLYLEFNLSEAERREAQDKIYALKAESELAAGKAAKAAAAKALDTPQARESAFLKSLEGAMFSFGQGSTCDGCPKYEWVCYLRNEKLHLAIQVSTMGIQDNSGRYDNSFLSASGINRVGLHDLDILSIKDGAFSHIRPHSGGATDIYRLRQDGQALTVQLIQNGRILEPMREAARVR